MLARIQQITTLSLLLAAVSWATWFGSRGHPGWALGGAGFILLGYALVLGFEFVLVAATHGADPAPRASVAQLLHAWVGEVVTAPRVFCWRQPFRSQVMPDWLPAQARGRRGVVLVHGFVCNRGLWNPWMARLRQAGVPHIAVNLEPVFGSIDDCTPTVDRAVRELLSATGLPPIIVAHSMGGLVTRAWMRQADRLGLVHRVVTIGTPHHGTWLARFATTLNGRQMLRGGSWLTLLERDEAQRPNGAAYGQFTCFYSHCDNIVFPPRCATLTGADNRHVPAVAHVDLAFHEEVYREVLRSVADDGKADQLGSRLAQ
jgi:pimeloyl-ACP methyl ester carboxylesterase